MKILFICGCLEPGKDGVGDYTRRLSAELMRQGISVGILALNDDYVAVEEQGNQTFEKVSIPILRIPSKWSRAKQIKSSKLWIEGHNPEWLSLQFVTYSFSKKGLPFGLGNQLKKIGESRKWHIMFHELWIGMEMGASVKDKLLGGIQKNIIKSLVNLMKPTMIHTQTHLYIKQLNHINIKANYLSLFSNVPLQNKNAQNITAKKNIFLKKEITFVIFGGIHPNAPVELFASEVAKYAKDYKFDITLITIGRNGSELDKWATCWKRNGLLLKKMGEQSLEVISDIMINGTIGLTTTPLILCEKSGSVVAMNSHGLPVICVSRNWHSNLSESIEIDNFINYEVGNFEYCLLESLKIDIKNNSISKIAKTFFDTLILNNTNG